METAKFLLDGTIVEVVEVVNGKYLVNPYVYMGDPNDGDYYEEILSGNLRLVEEVYDHCPHELIQPEMREAERNLAYIKSNIASAQTELYKIKSEIKKLEGTKTDLNKMIVNFGDFRNAETLTFMLVNRWVPYTVNNFKTQNYGNPINGFCVYFTATYAQGEKVEHVASLDYDGRSYGSDKLNLDFGILINATSEEIISKTKQINANREPNHYFDSNIPDMYLTEEQIIRKQDIIKRKKEGEIHSIETKISELKQQLKKAKS